MAQCKKCLADIKGDAKFCSKCGTSVQSTDVTPGLKKTANCENCGAQVALDSKNCWSCRGELFTTETHTPKQNISERLKSISACVLIGFFGGFTAEIVFKEYFLLSWFLLSVASIPVVIRYRLNQVGWSTLLVRIPVYGMFGFLVVGLVIFLLFEPKGNPAQIPDTQDKAQTQESAANQLGFPFVAGMYYTFYRDGSCVNHEKQKCLSAAQYQKLCSLAKGYTSEMVKRATFLNPKAKALFEAGNISDLTLNWNNGGACFVHLQASGIFDGSSAIATIFAPATGFVENSPGKVYVEYVDGWAQ